MSDEPINWEIPAWLPPIIRKALAQLAALNLGQETMDLARRLACDERMERVWHELNKFKRGPHEPGTQRFHSAKLPNEIGSWSSLAAAQLKHAAQLRAVGEEQAALGLERLARLTQVLGQARSSGELTPDMEHQLSIALMFVTAISIRWHRAATVTRSDYDARIGIARRQGKEAVAEALERRALEPDVARYIDQRRHADPEMGAFIEGMAQTSERVFGQVNASVIATITSVAFNREDMNRDNVRTKLRTRRRDRESKKA